MKARKPNTDQDAEVSVFINNRAATEYGLPSPKAAESRENIVECFIPVSEGDRITVKGRFSGTVLNGSIDLVVDGSFLFDSRIEGPTLKLVENRKIDFKKALNCPIPQGWTSIETPKDMEEGTLQAKRLDHTTVGDLTRFELTSTECAKPGLGSLQVIISVSQQPQDRYYDKYLDITNGHWRTRDSQLVRKSGVLPDHELTLEVDEEISQKRSAKHRHHWDQIRYGREAWAKFVFYYRSSDAIKKAGCVPLPDKVQDLKPGDAATFVRAPAKANRKRQQSTDGDEEDSISVAASSAIARSMDKTPASEKQPKQASEQRSPLRSDPPKRLGGTLNLPPSAARSSIFEDYRANRRSASASVAETDISEADKAYEPEEDALRQPVVNGAGGERGSNPMTQDFGDFGGPVELGLHVDSAGGVANNTLTATSGSVTASYMKAAGSSHESTSARDGPTSTAFMTASLPHQFGTPHDSPSTPNTEVTNNMSRPNVARVADLRRVPTTQTIHDAIPAHGIDGFQLNMVYVDAGPYKNDEQSLEEFERRRNEVAVLDPDEDQWYTKEMYAAKQGSRSPRRDSALYENQTSTAPIPAEAAQDNIFGQNSQLFYPPAAAAPEPAENQDSFGDGGHFSFQSDSDAMQIKQEELDADVPPRRSTPAPELPSAPQLKPASSTKRPSSSRPASSTPGTQSPASKRAKAQSSDRKANLQQQLAAKQARKEEMRKKLKQKDEAREAKRKQAEEKRKREEQEIAELERLNAEQDAELEAMEQQLLEDDQDEDEDFEEDE